MTPQKLIDFLSHATITKRRKESRRGELLNAALDLFVEKGFSATRANEVASRAGVSKGTLFLYFQTKEELFKAVVLENSLDHFPALEHEFNKFEGSSAEMLHYAMNFLWERIGKTRASGLTKLVMSEAQNFPEIANFYYHEVIKPGQSMIGRILERGMLSGEFRKLDVDQAVQILIAPMIFLMMWKHSMGACATSENLIDQENFIYMQVNALLHGINA
jgi:AcrR family transcriptional regulator